MSALSLADIELSLADIKLSLADIKRERDNLLSRQASNEDSWNKFNASPEVPPAQRETKTLDEWTAFLSKWYEGTKTSIARALENLREKEARLREQESRLREQESRLREQKELREKEERESQEPSMKLARFGKKLDAVGWSEPEPNLMDMSQTMSMCQSAYAYDFRKNHRDMLMNALRPPRQLYPFSSMAMAMRDQPSMYAPLAKAQLVRLPKSYEDKTPKRRNKLKTMGSLRTLLIDRLIPPKEVGRYGKHTMSKGGMHKSRSKSKCRSKSKSKSRHRHRG